MIVQDDDPRAFWQTLAMGRVSGVNLGAAVVEGWLDRAEFDGLVDRCSDCGRQDDCMHWLGQPQPWPRPAPDFCANATGLSMLSGG
ncbi:MAG TPA: DUF6455 family protein [Paracoccaceae bacterium]|nr:DUF6455 family protein [Paracoccaceae bacterium]